MLEMKTLEIDYPNGHMNIRLDVFLKDYGVNRFKKLLKIIKTTYKSDEYISTIKEYIENNMPVSSDELREKLVRNEFLVKVAQDEIDRLTKELNRLKEITKRMMQLGKRAKTELTILREQKSEVNDKLKNAKEQLRHYKAVCSGLKSDIKTIEKLKKDFKKYLEILNEV